MASGGLREVLRVRLGRASSGCVSTPRTQRDAPACSTKSVSSGLLGHCGEIQRSLVRVVLEHELLSLALIPVSTRSQTFRDTPRTRDANSGERARFSAERAAASASSAATALANTGRSACDPKPQYRSRRHYGIYVFQERSGDDRSFPTYFAQVGRSRFKFFQHTLHRRKKPRVDSSHPFSHLKL